MKTKNSTFILLLLLAVFTRCNNVGTSGDQSMNEADSTSEMTNPDARPVNNTGQVTSEAEALAVLNAINQNEIDAGNLAKEKKISQPVMDYASMLINDHSQNMDKTRQLASSMNMTLDGNSHAVMDVGQKGANMLASLRPLEGNEFEAAFLDAMVQGHSDAVDKLNNQLIPAANDEKVRQHLTDTRTTVQMHLDEAKKLRGGEQ